ncbi:hypothetical protein BSU04_01700 [Caballeronia sordidicola]|uniref:Uncharacterized protein n=1 Tax=Caballeronia sordidicola TaxID=196367 RepID=A0A226XAF4_CABSO|nr:hypothetical protein BSU04_01700 [Caballeronia sordidicola]
MISRCDGATKRGSYYGRLLNLASTSDRSRFRLASSAALACGHSFG